MFYVYIIYRELRTIRALYTYVPDFVDRSMVHFITLDSHISALKLEVIIF